MTINSEAELLKSFGRFGDNYLAHIGGGERVLPPRGVLPESVDRDPIGSVVMLFAPAIIQIALGAIKIKKS